MRWGLESVLIILFYFIFLMGLGVSVDPFIYFLYCSDDWRDPSAFS